MTLILLWQGASGRTAPLWSSTVAPAGAAVPVLWSPWVLPCQCPDPVRCPRCQR
jgi:hypothetical protein